MLELERRDLLLQWSQLDSQLQTLQESETERSLPLPPHLRTLEAYLQEREKQREKQQEAISRLSLAIQSPVRRLSPESSETQSLTSIPLSLQSTNVLKSPIEPEL